MTRMMRVYADFKLLSVEIRFICVICVLLVEVYLFYEKNL